MSLVGHSLRYRVPEAHQADTVVGSKTVTIEVTGEDGQKQQVARQQDVTAAGSIYHREMTEFAGIVTRDLGDGRFEIALFVPGKRELVHVASVPEPDADTLAQRYGVPEGDGPGTLTILTGDAAKPDAPKKGGPAKDTA